MATMPTAREKMDNAVVNLIPRVVDAPPSAAFVAISLISAMMETTGE
jgi:hypothetical protein